MYRAWQCSEFRLRIKRVSNFQFVVCLQIDPLAGDLMNSKLFLISNIQISRSLYRQHVGVFVNKPSTSSQAFKPLTSSN